MHWTNLMGRRRVKEEREKNKKERVSCYGRFGLARWRKEKQKGGGWRTSERTKEKKGNRETVQSERERFEQFFLDFLDKERSLRRGQSILNVVGYLDVLWPCWWLGGRGRQIFFFFFFYEKYVCKPWVWVVNQRQRIICTSHTGKVIAIFKTSLKYFYNKYNFFWKNI